MSFGGGGWISRFGLAETNSEALTLSERRMVGTDVEGRRGGPCFLDDDATGSGGGGAGVGALKTGAG